MSFQTAKKAVYAACHLSGYFAEKVEFTPEPGGQSRKIWCSITPESNEQESDGTTDIIDRYSVFLGRDESNETRGGVWDLKFNASILRSASKDPNRTPMFFTGEIVEQSDAFTRAIFMRRRRKAQGRDK